MSAAARPIDADPTAAELIAARPHFSFHAMDGLLLEGVPLSAIADALGTPAWVYGAATLRARYRRLAAAMAPLGAHIHYAVKANDHLAILSLLRREGAGADVVSLGEFLRARAAGVPADAIVFSGVGKSAGELTRALCEGVGQINVESAEELDLVDAVARGLGCVADVVVRLNPDVDAGTHAKITTGRLDNKFGVSAEVALELYRGGRPNVAVRGLALHIGSQIAETAPYRAAFAVARALILQLRADGHRVDVMDCGGGLGIGYRDEAPGDPAAWAGAIRAAFGDLDVRLMVEPGRWLVGPCGVLLASVAVTKTNGARRFVVLDAAMNDLVRPAMYDAWHGIVPLSAVTARLPAQPVDVVGPVCETGDTFARHRALPPLRPGERVALLDAGAYGAVMSGSYNARPLAPIALVDGDRWAAVRDRQPIEALWAGERVPEWL